MAYLKKENNMKLYATVTSERASKGQGGEYLDIEIKNELKIVFATIKVREQAIEIWYDGETNVTAFKDSRWNREIYDYQNKKGEKQKAERCTYCESLATKERDGHEAVCDIH